MSRRTELIETARGTGQLRLSDSYTPVEYTIRIYQEYDGEVPTLKSANGGLGNLPQGTAYSMINLRKPVELELEDGRRANVILTGIDGKFTVTGPVS